MSLMHVWQVHCGEEQLVITRAGAVWCYSRDISYANGVYVMLNNILLCPCCVCKLFGDVYGDSYLGAELNCTLSFPRGSWGTLTRR